MFLADPVDLYCERMAHGLWEEPLNAISNLAFFVASYLLYRLQKKHPVKQLYLVQNYIVIALVALVGLGSLVFHTFANVFGLISDIAGIMVFVHTYLYLCLRRILGWNRKQSAILVILLFISLMLMENFPKEYSLNGSIAYAPCLIIIIWMWSTTHRIPTSYASCYLYAAILMTISLIFRTMDNAICETFSIGTHFLWHVCNGAVLYLLSKVLILPGKPHN